MYKLTNLLCVLFIASFINAGILFFSSVHWWIPCSRTETSNVASLRYTLRFLPYLFAYCATPLLPMFHWWENEGQEPPGDILMMTQWARWQEKKKSPYRQPNSLPKSQFNLATLLLCYKMNNCLWVHSQAHYCFYITSKSLRQAKDIALLIVLRNSAFPCGKESALEAHL